MKEGFYFYRNRVYYGCYDETQTNGESKITIIKPEHEQTDHSAWAVRFRAEYIQMKGADKPQKRFALRNEPLSGLHLKL